MDSSGNLKADRGEGEWKILGKSLENAWMPVAEVGQLDLGPTLVQTRSDSFQSRLYPDDFRPGIVG
jgi:hypothetical protein